MNNFFDTKTKGAFLVIGLIGYACMTSPFIFSTFVEKKYLHPTPFLI